MDLSSMLNDVDAKPPVPSRPAQPVDLPAAVKIPPSPPPAASQDGGQSLPDENSEPEPSRKRQRVEEPQSPSSVALPTAKTSQPSKPSSGASSGTQSTAVSPEQEKRVLPVQRGSISVPKDILEPTITNVEPSEEVTRLISDFIFVNIEEGYENLEIEAKLGRIINVSTGERIRLPVRTETIVVPDTSEFSFHTRFESNMTEKQHKSFNQFLNKAVQTSRTPQANGAGSMKPPRVPLDYKHTKQIDSSYQFPNEPNSRNAQKIRVTRDPQGNVLETIIKENKGHLNIYSPRTAFDWRVSINNERKVELPPGVELRSERRKDRMTYLHQHIQIDLTQVVNPAEKEKSHELEVELRDIEALKAEAENAKQGKASKYEDLVKVFVDNVRLLARNAISN